MTDKVLRAMLWVLAAIGVVIVSLSFGNGSYVTGIIMIVVLLIFGFALGTKDE